MRPLWLNSAGVYTGKRFYFRTVIFFHGHVIFEFHSLNNFSGGLCCIRWFSSFFFSLFLYDSKKREIGTRQSVYANRFETKKTPIWNLRGYSWIHLEIVCLYTYWYCNHMLIEATHTHWNSRFSTWYYNPYVLRRMLKIYGFFLPFHFRF